MQLLEHYKKLVANDPGLRSPGPARRARAVDVARSVEWMVGSHGQYAWLRDLYRLVFGFHVEEGEGREGVVIQSSPPPPSLSTPFKFSKKGENLAQEIGII